MLDLTQFNVATAAQHYREGKLEEWVHSYITQGRWANLELSIKLKEKKRFWLGPVRIAFSNVDRQCGPEVEMIYHEPREVWDYRLKEMSEGIIDPLHLPPPLVNTMNGTLKNADGTLRFVLADGTHRVEALKLKCLDSFWFIIWFETQQQLDSFLSQEKPELFGM